MTIFKQAINFIKDTEAVLMQAQKKLSFAFFYIFFFQEYFKINSICNFLF